MILELQFMGIFTGWWFGTWILFFLLVGNVIIPTDVPSYFSDG